MFGMAGSSVHPDVVRLDTSTGAPHVGHVVAAPAEALRQ
jgi:hypothetical protein